MSAVIEIDQLQKRFGAIDAVSDVSLSVGAGESFGYLGPNGSGKTTTIRCMLGLIKPSAGHVRLFEQDVATSLPGILRDVGYLPGEFGLWPQMTGLAVLEYLAALQPTDAKRQHELCDRFELSRADLNRQVRFYSRGMKQKVGLVQAFQHDPALVVLDEPTEGLDPLMQDRFVDLLNEHTARGGTVFLSSHILSAVELATDRVGIVKSGKIVKIGATQDLSGERARRVTLVFKENPRRDLLELPGVEDLRIDGLRSTFTYRGDMDALLLRLMRARIEDLLIEPVRLSDAFFDIYGDA